MFYWASSSPWTATSCTVSRSGWQLLPSFGALGQLDTRFWNIGLVIKSWWVLGDPANFLTSPAHVYLHLLHYSFTPSLRIWCGFHSCTSFLFILVYTLVRADIPFAASFSLQVYWYPSRKLSWPTCFHTICNGRRRSKKCSCPIFSWKFRRSPGGAFRNIHDVNLISRWRCWFIDFGFLSCFPLQSLLVWSFWPRLWCL